VINAFLDDQFNFANVNYCISLYNRRNCGGYITDNGEGEENNE